MKTKKELLQQIENLEVARLNSLTVAEKYMDIETWFMECTEDHEESTLEEMLNDYLIDFMSWQLDKSMEELEEVINNYNVQANR